MLSSGIQHLCSNESRAVANADFDHRHKNWSMQVDDIELRLSKEDSISFYGGKFNRFRGAQPSSWASFEASTKHSLAV